MGQICHSAYTYMGDLITQNGEGAGLQTLDSNAFGIRPCAIAHVNPWPLVYGFSDTCRRSYTATSM
jgi:hypothetical protein